MLIDFFNRFVKITAYPVQKLIFRTKVYYQDKNVQSRHIKGAAIVISNHTSVFDSHQGRGDRNIKPHLGFRLRGVPVCVFHANA